MHTDPSLHSPTLKKDISISKTVEEFKEPMQIEEKSIPVILSGGKAIEKVVSVM
jgi:hypothetical protein